MSRVFSASLASLSLISAAGSAAMTQVTPPAPPEGLTWFVLNEINGFYLDRDDPTNRPPLVTEVPNGVLVPVDISKDGHADWLINWPDSTQFCGTGGCERTLYVSAPFEEGPVEAVDGTPRPYGFVRAFDRQAGDLEIRTVQGEVRIESSFHHLYCQDTRDDCRLAWGWDPRSRSLVERPSSDGQTVILSAGNPAVDLGDENGQPVLPNGLPDAVYALRAAGRRICPSAVFEDVIAPVYPDVSQTPDLNGDGVRDWVVGSPPECRGGPEPTYSYQVWVSQPDSGEPNGARRAVMAYQAPLDRWAHIDVGSTPARLIDVAGCDYGKSCPGVTLRWDEGSGRLVE